MLARQLAGLLAVALIAVAAIAIPAEPSFSFGPYAVLAHVSFAMWRGLPIHAGQVVEFGPGSNAGSAARCAKEGDCNLAQSATIVFDSYEERSGANGHYEMNFKGGETLKGSFEVKWCEERVICA